jgi:hypothetical protein
LAYSISVYGLISSIFFFPLRVNIKNAFAVLLVLFMMNSAFITHATPAYLFSQQLSQLNK